MSLDRTRRRVLATGSALLGTVAGCQGLFGDGDDESQPDSPDDGSDDGDTGATGETDGDGTAPGTDDSEDEPGGDPVESGPEPVTVGEGAYLESVPADRPAPPDPALADGVEPPVPTSEWWSSLLWERHGAHLWSHPLVTSPGSEGLAVGAPREWSFTDDGPAGPNFAHLPWTQDLRIASEDGPGPDRTVVTDWGDWSVDYRLDGTGIAVTQARGSPFVACTTDESVAVTVEDDADVSAFAEMGSTVGLTVDGRPYGLYAPTGAEWSRDDSAFTSDLRGDEGSGYVAVAALPEAAAETLRAYGEYAHAHVTDTRVEWTYDQAAGVVRTTYRFETVDQEGDAGGTITALYPHQHRHTDATLREESYVSPRGRMRPLAVESFETIHPFHGILPVVPGGDEGVADLLSAASTAIDSGESDPTDGVYWRGKNFTRLTALANVAERVGDADVAGEAVESVRSELATWLSADRAADGDGVATEHVFAYNQDWGTLQAYPAGFGAAESLNDHHFHYGQFVRGAAAVARFDPAWARDYGGMVEHLIRDYAGSDRDDDLFPFLRNFDPYAGHSWASGVGGAAGNNQESSSEAVNAYAAMIYWGEYTGNERLRDAGVYLYTHETLAAREYWFDERGETLPDAWAYDYACQVWDSGVHWTTWWTDEPEAIYLINALPIGGHSLYLGLDDGAADAAYAELLDNDDAPSDYWPAILAKFRALSDPADAREQWRGYPGGEPEMGTSRAHARHWTESLAAIGTPDPEVRADHPLAAVFERDGTRTYVAYNAGEDPLDVSFSDGTTVTVPPHSLSTA